MAMGRDLNIQKTIEYENKGYIKEMPFILEFVREEELVSIPESDIFTWQIIRTRPGRGRRPRSGEEEIFVEESV